MEPKSNQFLPEKVTITHLKNIGSENSFQAGKTAETQTKRRYPCRVTALATMTETPLNNRTGKSLTAHRNNNTSMSPKLHKSVFRKLLELPKVLEQFTTTDIHDSEIYALLYRIYQRRSRTHTNNLGVVRFVQASSTTQDGANSRWLTVHTARPCRVHGTLVHYGLEGA